MNSQTHRDSRRKEETRRRKGSQGFGKLSVDESMLDHSTYVYRWLNDEQNGRIYSKTKMDDWDLVPNAGVKEDSTDLGDMVSVPVGTHENGTPKRAYLARKLKTYYDDDRAEAQRELDRQLAEMRRGNDRDGAPLSDYIPRSGIRIEA